MDKKKRGMRILLISVISIYVLITLLFIVEIYIKLMIDSRGIRSFFEKTKTISEKDIYDFNTSGYTFASTQNAWINILENGEEYEIRLSGHNTDKHLVAQLKPRESADYFSANIVLTNDNLVVEASGSTIFYFDVKNKKIIRKISELPHDTVVAIYENRDLIFFSDGGLYRYYYDSDKLELIKAVINYEVLLPEPSEDINTGSNLSLEYPYIYLRPIQICYSKKYNRVYYKTLIYDEGEMKEYLVSMSLENFKVNVICRDAEVSVDPNGNIFYAHKNIVYKYDEDSKKSIKVFEHSDNIHWFKVFKNEIFFMQKSNPNIKGVRFPEFRVYHEGRVKYVKINSNIYFNSWDIVKPK